MKNSYRILSLLLLTAISFNVSGQDIKHEQQTLKAFYEYTTKSLKAFKKNTDSRLITHFKNLQKLARNESDWLTMSKSARAQIGQEINTEIDAFQSMIRDGQLTSVVDIPCIKGCMDACKEPSGKPDYICRMYCYLDCPPL